MKIAYLDPPYSRHFHHLAAAMAQRTGGTVLALLTSPAYRLYTMGDEDRVWNGEPSERAWRVPDAYERSMLVDTRDAQFQRMFAGAVEWLRETFVREGIETCLVFSDVRPFSVAARLAAEQAGVVCVWFERGAWRYGTSSLSTSGLNARFDLASARMDTSVEGISIRHRIRRREPVRWLRLRFALFMAWNRWVGLRHAAVHRLQHKEYGWRHYVRLGWRQWREGRRTPVPAAELHPDRSRPLILVPLQLETDSQFRASSPFADNHAFVDYLLPEILAACPQARILVKKHPMDAGRYELPRGADWVEGPLSRLFARASAVVCINSTVGFEAATHGKRVLCFGESFYTAGPIITRVTPETFRERLRHAVGLGDDLAGGLALRALVLRHYQTPGDAWAYTRTDIEASADIVLQHVAAARARLDSKRAAAQVAARVAAANDHATRPARAAPDVSSPPEGVPISARASPASG